MDNSNALVSVNSLITAKEQELEALRVARDILSGGYHSDQNAIVQGIADGVEQKLPQEVAARTATLEAEKAALESEKATLTTDNATLEAHNAALEAAKEALETQVADIPTLIAEATAPLEAEIAEKETLLAEKEARVVELEAAAQAVVNIDPIPAEEVTP